MTVALRSQAPDAASELRIVPVLDAKALREFVMFPFRLYRNEPHWVPPFIEERLDFFNTKKNPFFAHARAQLFLARRNGEVVGTIAAVVDDNHNTFHNDQQGAFGFFETVDDPAVAAALLQRAEDWVAQQGMRIIRGPLNFSINHEYGLLIDGFDTAPMVMMTHNPRYYARLVENAGFTKAMDMYAYIGDIDERFTNAPPKVFRVAEKVMRKEGLRVRKMDMRHYAEEVQRVLEVYGQAWHHLWDYVPITPAEAQQVAAQLKLIIDPDLAFIAETADGKPVGVAVSLPDLNQALRLSGGGSMYSFDMVRFLWQRRHINQIRLWAMGVVDEYHGRGIDAIFYVETARAALAKGHKLIEGSLILENNVMMNRIIERLGGQRYKTYRVYEKTLR